MFLKFYFAIGFLTIYELAYSQIPQGKPELCGKSGIVVLPPNVLAEENKLIVIPREGTVGVETKVNGNVDQVCPLVSGRYLVFVLTSISTYQVVIADGTTGTLIDEFYTYDPVVSPDQHWLAFRDFYPRFNQMTPSEEYLLYDLTKTAAGNTMPKPTFSTEFVRGMVVYPGVAEGKPFHHFGLPDNQRHTFGSESFYWSSDSKTFAFADKVQDVLSIVLVVVNPDSGPKTLVHRVTPAELCREYTFLVKQIEVHSKIQKVQMRIKTWDEGSDDCRQEYLTYDWSDFVTPIVEEHLDIEPKGEVVILNAPKK